MDRTDGASQVILIVFTDWWVQNTQRLVICWCATTPFTFTFIIDEYLRLSCTRREHREQRGLLTEPVWTYFPRVYWWRLRRWDTWRTRWSLLAAAGLMWVGLHTHTHTNTDLTTSIALTHIYIHQLHARAYVFVCMERWPAAIRRGTGCHWGPERSCCTSRLLGRCNTRPWTPGLRRRR